MLFCNCTSVCQSDVEFLKFERCFKSIDKQKKLGNMHHASRPRLKGGRVLEQRKGVAPYLQNKARNPERSAPCK